MQAPLADHRLALYRGALVGLEATGLLALTWGLGAHLPLGAMLGVLGLHGLLALAAFHPALAAPARCPALWADAAALAALVHFSGGYANPFIALLLVPLLLAAVVCRLTQVGWIALWVALLYSLLARYYHPLQLDLPEATAIHLHLVGMWLNFLITVVLVTLFVAQLSAALRAREAALQAAREKALRDEQLFALGMQSAAAAHDLATPLASLSLGLDELAADYAGDEALSPPLKTLRQQAARMQAVLARLAQIAGASPPPPQAAADWLAAVFEHWQLMRPGVPARLDSSGLRAAAPIAPPASVVSIIATLLNNAADASPQGIALEATQVDDALVFRVLDQSPGLAQGPAKPEGWGVGLQLSEAALERLGGHLAMSPRPEGGLCVEAHIPLAGLGA